MHAAKTQLALVLFLTLIDLLTLLSMMLNFIIESARAGPDLFMELAVQFISSVARLMKKKEHSPYDLVTFLPVTKENSADIETILRELLWECQWDNAETVISRVYLVNMGAELESWNTCKAICEETDFFELCNTDEIESLVKR